MLKDNLPKRLSILRDFTRCKPINLHEPFIDIGSNKVRKLKNLSVSTVGKETILFENELKIY